ncbi:DUF3383 domain-containing protein [Paraburkholderia panacisoli]|uniref:DUF3383 domain-containing protein n=1 Tax=Paraburkholderia panacisoli TaxID=2603818 RepID=A0A5B0HDB2_9BURK|nr:DUF3383 domain-containing protein [Paraburkholderia panacisoli]KAA1013028.1 DUF3383 domain-containing protein [Paraburkholderia panacisoli]
MASIPASAIVSVVPSVISAGGSALELIGLCLTSNPRVPTGQVLSFPSASAVSSYFGPVSVQAAQAAIYFAGFEGSNVLPAAMLFAQYNLAAVPGYLRGGSVSGLTLTQLQALSGTLTITFAGTGLTSSTINLSSATSFSNAATIIQAAFTSPPFAVTYDSVSGAFVFTSTASGATATITYATGTLAAGLLLTQAAGATLSQGAAAAAAPAAYMNGIVAQTTNWASFFTDFDPDAGSGNALKYAFAAWAGTTQDEFVYFCEDADITPTQSTNAASSLGQKIIAAGISGTAPIYVPSIPYGLAAFASGSVASIDFTETNGQATLAFKSQSGIVPSVTNQTVAANLQANGYCWYGAYATANQGFEFFYPGTISGPFEYIDAYVGQIWLNSALQLALIELLVNVKSIPYSPSGYALISAAMMDPINAALNFGLITPNVTLSSAQQAEVNNAAGKSIAGNLQSQGYYLQVLPASSQARGNRQSPPVTLWYCSGGAVQQINVASVEVQ